MIIKHRQVILDAINDAINQSILQSMIIKDIFDTINDAVQVGHDCLHPSMTHSFSNKNQNSCSATDHSLQPCI